jgi:hypothetical protein|eukprot:COSAG01_NODE_5647_length_4118_cov_6.676288_6_plen_198_part_00
MAGDFGYSKWDNLDTGSSSSSDDDGEGSVVSAGAMRELHTYAAAQGMDAGLVSDTLAQFGSDPVQALAYLRDFFTAEAPPAGASSQSAPAAAAAAAAATPAPLRTATSAGTGQRRLQLQAELTASQAQLAALREKRASNETALQVLGKQKTERPPHMTGRANRQWVSAPSFPRAVHCVSRARLETARVRRSTWGTSF